MPPTCLVAQIGARLHYAVPRLLHEAGRLEHLCTDICANIGWPRALQLTPEALRTPALRRFLDRVPAGIPASHLTAFPSFGVAYSQRLARARTPSEITATILWAGRKFGELAVARGLRKASVVYAFNNAALELLRHARDHDRLAVLEQTIAPKRIEMEWLERARTLHPGWDNSPRENEHLEKFYAREKAEWDAADLILCGSEFVRDGIAQCGGPVQRCHVVPPAVDHFFSPKARVPHPGPLRVLTVGAVGLRKGSPDVLATAQRLSGRAIFRLVGPIEVAPDLTQRLRAEVDLTGSVPRSEMAAHYQWADVFLLPSLCEGSATAACEAMACGLPVIATPNAGTRIRDGIEGFLVPPGDVDRISASLKVFLEAPELLRAMARRARVRAEEYDLRAYGRQLLGTLFPARKREDIAA